VRTVSGRAENISHLCRLRILGYFGLSVQSARRAEGSACGFSPAPCRQPPDENRNGVIRTRRGWDAGRDGGRLECGRASERYSPRYFGRRITLPPDVPLEPKYPQGWDQRRAQRTRERAAAATRGATAAPCGAAAARVARDGEECMARTRSSPAPGPHRRAQRTRERAAAATRGATAARTPCRGE